MGSDGAFLFDGLAPGDYTIRAEKTPAYTPNNAMVSVEPNGEHTQDISLTAKPGSIAGLVRDKATGEPISGAQVLLVESSSSDTTDSTGAYSFSDVPRGDYTLRVSATGYTTADALVTVEPGIETARDVDFEGPLAGPALSIVLEWEPSGVFLDPRDLDSHLWLPAANPYHVYSDRMGNDAAFPFAILDQDDLTGADPETVVVHRAYEGDYRYAVHKFSGTAALRDSGARVRIFSGDDLLTTINAPSGGSGCWWNVFGASFDEETSSWQITTVNDIVNQSPHPPPYESEPRNNC